MKSLRLLIPATLLALAAAGPAAAADKTETRAVTGFNGISLAAPIRVDLALGDQESLVIEGDAEALAAIETVVEKGSLRIRVRRDSHRIFDTRWDGEVRAKVTARRIEAIAIHGSGDIRSGRLTGENLAISISGSGDVKVEGGKVATLSVNISGSGDVRAARLESRTASVAIAGSGDATIWARESLAVKVAGSGDVGYYGDPTLARSIAGSGEVKRLGAAPN